MLSWALNVQLCLKFRWIKEFLQNRASGVKLRSRLSSESIVKKTMWQRALCLDPFCFWYQWFGRSTDMQKFVFRKIQRRWFSFHYARIWSSRCDLPINANKSQHLSIGCSPDDKISLFEEDERKMLPRCEQIKGQGLIVKTASFSLLGVTRRNSYLTLSAYNL